MQRRHLWCYRRLIYQRTLEIYFGKDRVNILQLWVQHPDEKNSHLLWPAPNGLLHLHNTLEQTALM